MPRMRDSDLRALMARRIEQAIAYDSGEVSAEREKSLNLYLAKPRGDEETGSSQVVTSEVQDVIESVMPEMMEIFASGDELGECEPVGPEDEQFSKQASEYVNYIWDKDNDGFGIAYDWIKDALTQKNGFIKVSWDDTPVTRKSSYTGLSTVDVMTLSQTDDVKITASQSRPAEIHEQQAYPDGEVWDVDIEYTLAKGKVKVVACPPEEILVGRRTIDLDDAKFVCHRTRVSRSDLKAQGYSDRILNRLTPGDASDINLEMTTRDQQSDNLNFNDDDEDKATQEVWVYECYTRVDYDGDGKSELRQITLAGAGYELLDNVEIDEQPIVSITPIRMPHQLFGRSLTDLIQDIQEIKTTVTRQLLNNMYQVNNARSIVFSENGKGVNIDDYLTNRVAGVVRTNMPVNESWAPIVTQPLGPQAFGVLEYWDTVRETRTGVTRYNQGLDANSLNKTATGIQQIISRAQKRMLLIARTFAQTGFKIAFKKILKQTIHHQDKPRVIRLRNEWVQMDPRDWNADMDININVGLGYGTKEQQTAMLERLLATQMQIVQFQQGLGGPLVTAENAFNALDMYPNALGYKGKEKFFTDPKTAPPQPPKPDPKMIEAQGKVAAKHAEVQGKLQTDQAKLSMEAQKNQQKAQQDAAKAQNDMHLAAFNAQMKAALEEQQAAHRMQLEEMKAHVDMAIATMREFHTAAVNEFKAKHATNGAAQ